MGSSKRASPQSLETDVYASEDSEDPTYEVGDEPSEDNFDDISTDSANSDEGYQSAKLFVSTNRCARYLCLEAVGLRGAAGWGRALHLPGRIE
ncbi:hypothetical protein Scep_030184 [Stephania cephalantha]|uniref:Uncharacterized protein n=1 Tax=Stephania cephalantha TaxID=152367 RepID=A0AAP0HCY3_9MAGN